MEPKAGVDLDLKKPVGMPRTTARDQPGLRLHRTCSGARLDTACPPVGVQVPDVERAPDDQQPVAAPAPYVIPMPPPEYCYNVSAKSEGMLRSKFAS